MLGLSRLWTRKHYGSYRRTLTLPRFHRPHVRLDLRISRFCMNAAPAIEAGPIRTRLLQFPAVPLNNLRICSRIPLGDHLLDQLQRPFELLIGHRLDTAGMLDLHLARDQHCADFQIRSRRLAPHPLENLPPMLLPVLRQIDQKPLVERSARSFRRDYPKDAYVFVSERGGPITLLASTASSSASGRPPRCPSRSTRTCCAMPVGSSSPTMATTRGPYSTTSGTRTSSTRSGTPRWRLIASRTFGVDRCRRRQARRRFPLDHLGICRRIPLGQ